MDVVVSLGCWPFSCSFNFVEATVVVILVVEIVVPPSHWPMLFSFVCFFSYNSNHVILAVINVPVMRLC